MAQVYYSYCQNVLYRMIASLLLVVALFLVSGVSDGRAASVVDKIDSVSTKAVGSEDSLAFLLPRDLSPQLGDVLHKTQTIQTVYCAIPLKYTDNANFDITESERGNFSLILNRLYPSALGTEGLSALVSGSSGAYQIRASVCTGRPQSDQAGSSMAYCQGVTPLPGAGYINNMAVRLPDQQEDLLIPTSSIDTTDTAPTGSRYALANFSCQYTEVCYVPTTIQISSGTSSAQLQELVASPITQCDAGPRSCAQNERQVRSSTYAAYDANGIRYSSVVFVECANTDRCFLSVSAPSQSDPLATWVSDMSALVGQVQQQGLSYLQSSNRLLRDESGNVITPVSQNISDCKAEAFYACPTRFTAVEVTETGVTQLVGGTQVSYSLVYCENTPSSTIPLCLNIRKAPFDDGVSFVDNQYQGDSLRSICTSYQPCPTNSVSETVYLINSRGLRYQSQRWECDDQTQCIIPLRFGLDARRPSAQEVHAPLLTSASIFAYNSLPSYLPDGSGGYKPLISEDRTSIDIGNCIEFTEANRNATTYCVDNVQSYLTREGNPGQISAVWDDTNLSFTAERGTALFDNLFTNAEGAFRVVSVRAFYCKEEAYCASQRPVSDRSNLNYVIDNCQVSNICPVDTVFYNSYTIGVGLPGEDGVFYARGNNYFCGPERTCYVATAVYYTSAGVLLFNDTSQLVPIARSDGRNSDEERGRICDTAEAACAAIENPVGNNSLVLLQAVPLSTSETVTDEDGNEYERRVGGAVCMANIGVNETCRYVPQAAVSHQLEGLGVKSEYCTSEQELVCESGADPVVSDTITTGYYYDNSYPTQYGIAMQFYTYNCGTRICDVPVRAYSALPYGTPMPVMNGQYAVADVRQIPSVFAGFNDIGSEVGDYLHNYTGYVLQVRENNCIELTEDQKTQICNNIRSDFINSNEDNFVESRTFVNSAVVDNNAYTLVTTGEGLKYNYGLRMFYCAESEDITCHVRYESETSNFLNYQGGDLYFDRAAYCNQSASCADGETLGAQLEYDNPRFRGSAPHYYRGSIGNNSIGSLVKYNKGNNFVCTTSQLCYVAVRALQNTTNSSYIDRWQHVYEPFGTTPSPSNNLSTYTFGRSASISTDGYTTDNCFSTPQLACAAEGDSSGLYSADMESIDEYSGLVDISDGTTTYRTNVNGVGCIKNSCLYLNGALLSTEGLITGNTLNNTNSCLSSPSCDDALRSYSIVYFVDSDGYRLATEVFTCDNVACTFPVKNTSTEISISESNIRNLVNLYFDSNSVQSINGGLAIKSSYCQAHDTATATSTCRSVDSVLTSRLSGVDNRVPVLFLADASNPDRINLEFNNSIIYHDDDTNISGVYIMTFYNCEERSPCYVNMPDMDSYDNVNTQNLNILTGDQDYNSLNHSASCDIQSACPINSVPREEKDGNGLDAAGFRYTNVIFYYCSQLTDTDRICPLVIKSTAARNMSTASNPSGVTNLSLYLSEAYDSTRVSTSGTTTSLIVGTAQNLGSYCEAGYTLSCPTGFTLSTNDNRGSVSAISSTRIINGQQGFSYYLDVAYCERTDLCYSLQASLLDDYSSLGDTPNCAASATCTNGGTPDSQSESNLTAYDSAGNYYSAVRYYTCLTTTEVTCNIRMKYSASVTQLNAASISQPSASAVTAAFLANAYSGFDTEAQTITCNTGERICPAGMVIDPADNPETPVSLPSTLVTNPTANTNYSLSIYRCDRATACYLAAPNNVLPTGTAPYALGVLDANVGCTETQAACGTNQVASTQSGTAYSSDGSFYESVTYRACTDIQTRVCYLRVKYVNGNTTFGASSLAQLSSTVTSTQLANAFNSNDYQAETGLKCVSRPEDDAFCASPQTVNPTTVPSSASGATIGNTLIESYNGSTTDAQSNFYNYQLVIYRCDRPDACYLSSPPTGLPAAGGTYSLGVTDSNLSCQQTVGTCPSGQFPAQVRVNGYTTNGTYYTNVNYYQCQATTARTCYLRVKYVNGDSTFGASTLSQLTSAVTTAQLSNAFNSGDYSSGTGLRCVSRPANDAFCTSPQTVNPATVPTTASAATVPNNLIASYDDSTSGVQDSSFSYQLVIYRCDNPVACYLSAPSTGLPQSGNVYPLSRTDVQLQSDCSTTVPTCPAGQFAAQAAGSGYSSNGSYYNNVTYYQCQATTARTCYLRVKYVNGDSTFGASTLSQLTSGVTSTQLANAYSAEDYSSLTGLACRSRPSSFCTSPQTVNPATVPTTASAATIANSLIASYNGSTSGVQDSSFSYQLVIYRCDDPSICYLAAPSTGLPAAGGTYSLGADSNLNCQQAVGTCPSGQYPAQSQVTGYTTNGTYYTNVNYYQCQATTARTCYLRVKYVNGDSTFGAGTLSQLTSGVTSTQLANAYSAEDYSSLAGLACRSRPSSFCTSPQTVNPTTVPTTASAATIANSLIASYNGSTSGVQDSSFSYQLVIYRCDIPTVCIVDYGTNETLPTAGTSINLGSTPCLTTPPSCAAGYYSSSVSGLTGYTTTGDYYTNVSGYTCLPRGSSTCYLRMNFASSVNGLGGNSVSQPTLINTAYLSNARSGYDSETGRLTSCNTAAPSCPTGLALDPATPSTGVALASDFITDARSDTDYRLSVYRCDRETACYFNYSGATLPGSVNAATTSIVDTDASSNCQSTEPSCPSTQYIQTQSGTAVNSNNTLYQNFIYYKCVDRSSETCFLRMKFVSGLDGLGSASVTQPAGVVTSSYLSNAVSGYDSAQQKIICSTSTRSCPSGLVLDPATSPTPVSLSSNLVLNADTNTDYRLSIYRCDREAACYIPASDTLPVAGAIHSTTESCRASQPDCSTDQYATTSIAQAYNSNGDFYQNVTFYLCQNISTRVCYLRVRYVAGNNDLNGASLSQLTVPVTSTFLANAYSPSDYNTESGLACHSRPTTFCSETNQTVNPATVPSSADGAIIANDLIASYDGQTTGVRDSAYSYRLVIYRCDISDTCIIDYGQNSLPATGQTILLSSPCLSTPPTCSSGYYLSNISVNGYTSDGNFYRTVNVYNCQQQDTETCYLRMNYSAAVNGLNGASVSQPSINQITASYLSNAREGYNSETQTITCNAVAACPSGTGLTVDQGTNAQSVALSRTFVENADNTKDYFLIVYRCDRNTACYFNFTGSTFPATAPSQQSISDRDTGSSCSTTVPTCAANQYVQTTSVGSAINSDLTYYENFYYARCTDKSTTTCYLGMEYNPNDSRLNSSAIVQPQATDITLSFLANARSDFNASTAEITCKQVADNCSTSFVSDSGSTEGGVAINRDYVANADQNTDYLVRIYRCDYDSACYLQAPQTGLPTASAVYNLGGTDQSVSCASSLPSCPSGTYSSTVSGTGYNGSGSYYSNVIYYSCSTVEARTCYLEVRYNPSNQLLAVSTLAQLTAPVTSDFLAQSLNTTNYNADDNLLSCVSRPNSFCAASGEAVNPANVPTSAPAATISTLLIGSYDGNPVSTSDQRYSYQLVIYRCDVTNNCITYLGQNVTLPESGATIAVTESCLTAPPTCGTGYYSQNRSGLYGYSDAGQYYRSVTAYVCQQLNTETCYVRMNFSSSAPGLGSASVSQPSAAQVTASYLSNARSGYNGATSTITCTNTGLSCPSALVADPLTSPASPVDLPSSLVSNANSTTNYKLVVYRCDRATACYLSFSSGSELPSTTNALVIGDSDASSNCQSVTPVCASDQFLTTSSGTAVNNNGTFYENFHYFRCQDRSLSVCYLGMQYTPDYSYLSGANVSQPPASQHNSALFSNARTGGFNSNNSTINCVESTSCPTGTVVNQGTNATAVSLSSSFVNNPVTGRSYSLLIYRCDSSAACYLEAPSTGLPQTGTTYSIGGTDDNPSCQNTQPQCQANQYPATSQVTGYNGSGTYLTNVIYYSCQAVETRVCYLRMRFVNNSSELGTLTLSQPVTVTSAYLANAFSSSDYNTVSGLNCLSKPTTFCNASAGQAASPSNIDELTSGVTLPTIHVTSYNGTPISSNTGFAYQLVVYRCEVSSACAINVPSGTPLPVANTFNAISSSNQCQTDSTCAANYQRSSVNAYAYLPDGTLYNNVSYYTCTQQNILGTCFFAVTTPVSDSTASWLNNSTPTTISELQSVLIGGSQSTSRCDNSTAFAACQSVGGTQVSQQQTLTDLTLSQSGGVYRVGIAYCLTDECPYYRNDNGLGTGVVAGLSGNQILASSLTRCQSTAQCETSVATDDRHYLVTTTGLRSLTTVFTCTEVVDCHVLVDVTESSLLNSATFSKPSSFSLGTYLQASYGGSVVSSDGQTINASFCADSLQTISCQSSYSLLSDLGVPDIQAQQGTENSPFLTLNESQVNGGNSYSQYRLSVYRCVENAPCYVALNSLDSLPSRTSEISSCQPTASCNSNQRVEQADSSLRAYGRTGQTSLAVLYNNVQYYTCAAVDPAEVSRYCYFAVKQTGTQPFNGTTLYNPATVDAYNDYLANLVDGSVLAGSEPNYTFSKDSCVTTASARNSFCQSQTSLVSTNSTKIVQQAQGNSYLIPDGRVTGLVSGTDDDLQFYFSAYRCHETQACYYQTSSPALSAASLSLITNSCQSTTPTCDSGYVLNIQNDTVAQAYDNNGLYYTNVRYYSCELERCYFAVKTPNTGTWSSTWEDSTITSDTLNSNLLPGQSINTCVTNAAQACTNIGGTASTDSPRLDLTVRINGQDRQASVVSCAKSTCPFTETSNISAKEIISTASCDLTEPKCPVNSRTIDEESAYLVDTNGFRVSSHVYSCNVGGECYLPILYSNSSPSQVQAETIANTRLAGYYSCNIDSLSCDTLTDYVTTNQYATNVREFDSTGSQRTVSLFHCQGDQDRPCYYEQQQTSVNTTFDPASCQRMVSSVCESNEVFKANAGEYKYLQDSNNDNIRYGSVWAVSGSCLAINTASICYVATYYKSMFTLNSELIGIDGQARYSGGRQESDCYDNRTSVCSSLGTTVSTTVADEVRSDYVVVGADGNTFKTVTFVTCDIRACYILTPVGQDPSTQATCQEQAVCTDTQYSVIDSNHEITDQATNTRYIPYSCSAKASNSCYILRTLDQRTQPATQSDATGTCVTERSCTSGVITDITPAVTRETATEIFSYLAYYCRTETQSCFVRRTTQSTVAPVLGDIANCTNENTCLSNETYEALITKEITTDTTIYNVTTYFCVPPTELEEVSLPMPPVVSLLQNFLNLETFAGDTLPDIPNRGLAVVQPVPAITFIGPAECSLAQNASLPECLSTVRRRDPRLVRRTVVSRVTQTPIPGSARGEAVNSGGQQASGGRVIRTKTRRIVGGSRTQTSTSYRTVRRVASTNTTTGRSGLLGTTRSVTKVTRQRANLKVCFGRDANNRLVRVTTTKACPRGTSEYVGRKALSYVNDAFRVRERARRSDFLVSSFSGGNSFGGATSQVAGYRVTAAVDSQAQNTFGVFATGFVTQVNQDARTSGTYTTLSNKGLFFGATAGFTARFGTNNSFSLGGVFVTGDDDTTLADGEIYRKSNQGFGAISQLRVSSGMVDLNARIGALRLESEGKVVDSNNEVDVSTTTAVTGQADVGVNFNTGDSNAGVTFRPFLGTTVTYVNQSKSKVLLQSGGLDTEASSGWGASADLGLNISSRLRLSDDVMLLPTLTGRASIPIRDLKFSSKAEVLDESGEGTGVFVNAVSAVQSRRASYTVAPKVALQIGNNITLGLGYSGTFAEGSQSHTGSGTLVFSF